MALHLDLDAGAVADLAGHDQLVAVLQHGDIVVVVDLAARLPNGLGLFTQGGHAAWRGWRRGHAARGRGGARGRRRSGRLGLLPRLVFVVGVLPLVEDPQPLGLFDVRLSGLLGQEFPPAPELFRYLGVVFIWRDLDDLSPLQLGPDHEGVHRPLDVV